MVVFTGILPSASALIAPGMSELALCEHCLHSYRQLLQLPGWSPSVNIWLPRCVYQVSLDTDGAPPIPWRPDSKIISSRKRVPTPSWLPPPLPEIALPFPAPWGLL